MQFKPKNTSNLTFRLADGIRARAEAFAEINNTTLSEVIRFSLKSLLDKSNVWEIEIEKWVVLLLI